MLQKAPIRIDRLNRPLPSPITRTSLQLRAETLPLYYQCNVFEFWRPLFWVHHDLFQSTFVTWLVALGREKVGWLQDLVLLYKFDNELEHDIQEPLKKLDFELTPGVVSNRQELTEYEMCFEELGLPRHFGRTRRWDRWAAANGSDS